MPIGVTLYVGVKFIAYSFWCGLGVALLRPRRDLKAVALPKQILWTLLLGALRLWMGVIFGVVIYLLSTSFASAIAHAPAYQLITYLVVYVPVRWVEWTIFAWFIAHGVRGIPWYFRWNDLASRWRLGGIAISCLADIPIIAMTDWSLPIGRFFC